MTRLTGSVADFDEARGLGVVVSSSGTRWPFHCVSIADGTRTIALGQAVEFSVEFRVRRLEAVDIEKS